VGKKRTPNIVGESIDEALGLIGGKLIGEAPHYQHRESCLRLSRPPLPEFDAAALIEDIFQKIQSNLSVESRSNENWRWVKNCAKKDNDGEKAVRREKKLEVRLEREIIKISKDWVNQVPTASGLLAVRSGNTGSIDLVHRCDDDSYEFIELKVTANNPLYAAMAILQYGILYMLAKHTMNAQEKKELLQAKVIHLKVLAPMEYYKRFKLDWLEKEINNGLTVFLKKKQSGFLMNLKMDFRFEAFPKCFSVSPSFPKLEVIKKALKDRSPVYSQRFRQKGL